MAAIDSENNRVEGAKEVSGSARCTGDGKIPNVTYAALVQSEIPRGEVTRESLEQSIHKALSSPDVLYEFRPLNAPKLRVFPRDLTFDVPLGRRPPLSDIKVQHVGQYMALVAAGTHELANHAASGFELEYVEQPVHLSLHDVIAAAVSDKKDGQVRHGSYHPDPFVKFEEEKLQDRIPPGHTFSKGNSLLQMICATLPPGMPSAF